MSESTKNSVLRVLESAKAKCAQAVLDGYLTVDEYERATGESGKELLDQVKQAVRADLAASWGALRGQVQQMLEKARDHLLAAGMEAEDISAELEAVTEGGVKAADVMAWVESGKIPRLDLEK